MTVHDFNACLDLSHEHSDAPWWNDVYRQAFPAFSLMHDVRQDGWAQRGGIDRQVILNDGTVLKVDEKVRAKDYDDILLERWSDRRRKRDAPGWVQKELTCDYIAYAFIPSRRCYLLPFQTLRRAWLLHGRRWIDAAYDGRPETDPLPHRLVGRDGFSVVPGANRSYVTESIAIPIATLMGALRDAMLVTWAAEREAA